MKLKMLGTALKAKADAVAPMRRPMAPPAGLGVPMKRGGKVMKKMADGGSASDYDEKNAMKSRNQRMETEYGKGVLTGMNRQYGAAKGSALNAYANRAKDFVSDKLTDADAAISRGIGLKDRAKEKEDYRQGLKGNMLPLLQL